MGCGEEKGSVVTEGTDVPAIEEEERTMENRQKESDAFDFRLFTSFTV
jgi:hypothetical protein